MRTRRGILVVAMIAVVLVFVVGVVQLVVYRLQTGTSYPPFSSLRADPLGTRVLAESLQRIDGLTVVRNYRPLPRPEEIPPDRTVLMILGVDPNAGSLVDPNRMRDRLDAFVRQGGRLVVGLARNPHSADHRFSQMPDENVDANSWMAMLLESDQLGWVPGQPPRFEVYDPPHKLKAKPTADGTRLGMSESIRMLPGYHLSEDPSDPWEVLLRDEFSAPVAIRRTLDRGEIIITGGTWWLANVSISRAAPLEAIAALVGDKRRVVIDETHLGIFESPGLARMTWEAGFAPAAGVLAAVALLFVWRNAARLAPARRMPRNLEGGRVLGRDANEGLVNLLRRSVPRNRLLKTCLDEWDKTVPAGRGDLKTKARKLRDAAEPYLNESNHRSIVNVYETLRSIASERK